MLSPTKWRRNNPSSEKKKEFLRVMEAIVAKEPIIETGLVLSQQHVPNVCLAQ